MSRPKNNDHPDVTYHLLSKESFSVLIFASTHFSKSVHVRPPNKKTKNKQEKCVIFVQRREVCMVQTHEAYGSRRHRLVLHTGATNCQTQVKLAFGLIDFLRWTTVQKRRQDKFFFLSIRSVVRQHSVYLSLNPCSSSALLFIMPNTNDDNSKRTIIR